MSSKGVRTARYCLASVIALGLLPGLAAAASQISAVTITQVSIYAGAGGSQGAVVTVAGCADANQVPLVHRVDVDL